MKAGEVIGYFFLFIVILYFIINVLITWAGWKASKYMGLKLNKGEYVSNMGMHGAKVMARPVTTPLKAVGSGAEKVFVTLLDPSSAKIEREKRKFFKNKINKEKKQKMIDDIIRVRKNARGNRFNAKRSMDYAKSKAESRLFYEPMGYYENSKYLLNYEGKGI